ncbi:MAG: hypothetical protein Q9183_007079, partial [Haloplaca sp. 2 TL-2023]
MLAPTWPQHSIHFYVLSSGILLLLAASHFLFHLDSVNPSTHPRSEYELTTTSSATLNSVAIPFGSADYSVNFSAPVIRSSLAKRAPPRTFEDARCQGAAYWTRIQETYGKPPKPGPQFSFSDLNAAWERTVREEESSFDLEDGFIPFVDQVVKGAVSHDKNNRTIMAQKSRYLDKSGRQQ